VRRPADIEEETKMNITVRGKGLVVFQNESFEDEALLFGVDTNGLGGNGLEFFHSQAVVNLKEDKSREDKWSGTI
jgi:hypothetical protein